MKNENEFYLQPFAANKKIVRSSLLSKLVKSKNQSSFKSPDLNAIFRASPDAQQNPSSLTPRLSPLTPHSYNIFPSSGNKGLHFLRRPDTDSRPSTEVIVFA